MSLKNPFELYTLAGLLGQAGQAEAAQQQMQQSDAARFNAQQMAYDPGRYDKTAFAMRAMHEEAYRKLKEQADIEIRKAIAMSHVEDCDYGQTKKIVVRMPTIGVAVKGPVQARDFPKVTDEMRFINCVPTTFGQKLRLEIEQWLPKLTRPSDPLAGVRP